MLDKEITTWDEAIKFAEMLYVYGNDGKQILCKLEQEPNTGRFGLRAFGSSVDGFSIYAEYEVESEVQGGNMAYSKIYMDGYWPHVTYGVTYSIPETVKVNGKVQYVDNGRSAYYYGQYRDMPDNWEKLSLEMLKKTTEIKCQLNHWVRFNPSLIYNYVHGGKMKDVDTYLTASFNGKTTSIYLETYQAGATQMWLD